MGGHGSLSVPWVAPPKKQHESAVHGGLLRHGGQDVGSKKRPDLAPSAVPIFSTAIEAGLLVAVKPEEQQELLQE